MQDNHLSTKELARYNEDKESSKRNTQKVLTKPPTFSLNCCHVHEITLSLKLSFVESVSFLPARRPRPLYSDRPRNARFTKEQFERQNSSKLTIRNKKKLLPKTQKNHPKHVCFGT